MESFIIHSFCNFIVFHCVTLPECLNCFVIKENATIKKYMFFIYAGGVFSGVGSHH